MKLGESGEAFFVYETEKGEGEIPAYLATSPIPISIAEEQSTNSGGYPKDLQNGTLMGNRDDGILNVKEDTSQEDIILGISFRIMECVSWLTVRFWNDNVYNVVWLRAFEECCWLTAPLEINVVVFVVLYRLAQSVCIRC